LNGHTPSHFYKNQTFNNNHRKIEHFEKHLSLRPRDYIRMTAKEQGVVANKLTVHNHSHTHTPILKLKTPALHLWKNPAKHKTFALKKRPNRPSLHPCDTTCAKTFFTPKSTTVFSLFYAFLNHFGLTSIFSI
jgi:hypothetical protein